MKLQFFILSVLFIFLCSPVNALFSSSWNFPLKINQFAVWPFVSKPGSSSYDSSNHNYFNDYDHGNKMNRPERNMESRSRFPRRLQHGNGGFGTTSRMAMNRPGPR